MFILFALINMGVKQLFLNYDNFVKTIFDSYVIETILLTFYAAFVATLITIIFGTPLAYLVAHYKFKGKALVNSIINIPIMIPHSVAGILILSLFSRHGWVGAPFREIGIMFEDNIIGIIVALLFVSMPIYINTVRDGFKGINPHLSFVAKSLGATERRIFIRVMLPLNKRNMVSGAVMCWARGISEFGAVVFIAYYPFIAPVLIYDRYITQGLSGSAPIAFLLIIICLFIFIIIYILTREKEVEKVI
ncbi:MAG: ABC transporter permease [Candidatus Lokiarchaeota archaeon]|nr:ABC transporter permease [Candidatus Lokiarchaeota archaeon]